MLFLLLLLCTSVNMFKMEGSSLYKHEGGLVHRKRMCVLGIFSVKAHTAATYVLEKSKLIM